jgi:hypothetical protein
MFLFASFDQYLRLKNVNFGIFYQDFIIKKPKQKITQLLPIKGGVV